MSITLDNTIWLAGMLTEAAVIWLLISRRVGRLLPVFLAYCIWDLLSNGFSYSMRYLIHSGYSGYLTTYFVETIIDSALQFSVLVELAWSVLRPIRSSLPRSALVAVGALILVAGAAIWPFASVSALVHVTSRQWLLMSQLGQTVSILRILFFLVLAAGSQFLSIGWRDRELQVATGLGFYSLVSVAVSILQAHQNTGLQYARLQQFAVVGFLCSLIYWVVSFSQREAERRGFTPQMERLLLAAAGTARSARGTLTESRINRPRKPGGI